MSLMDAVRADGRFSQLDGSSLGFGRQTVVVLDTGIDRDHPDFGAIAADGESERIVFSYDFSGGNDADAIDTDGHGTHVAGIVGSTDHGVAPDVDIVTLKVFPDGGKEGASDDDIAEALDWVIANAAAYNVVAVNMSFGTFGNLNTPTDSSYNPQFRTLAVDQRVALVVSAGNDFEDFKAPGVSSPAADPYVSAVGALDGGETGLADFSQRHPTLVDVVAPGSSIYSTVPDDGYDYASGTSIAAPFMTGIYALVQQLMVDISNYYTPTYHLQPSLMQYFLDKTADRFVDSATGAEYKKIDPLALFDYIYHYWLSGDATNQTLDGVEGDDDIDAAGGDDTVTGDYGDDLLKGGAGGDRLEGEWGDDTLDGGSNVDQLVGGDGDDTIIVDNARDVVVEVAGQGDDTVVAGASFDLADGQSIEHLLASVGAGSAALRLSGNEVSQRIEGGSGHDVIDGEGGADAMFGGAGDDVFFVDQPDDRVVELEGEGTDLVYSSVSHTLHASFAENLTLLGTAKIDATGNADANELVGNAGNNRLNGMAGGDSMAGGLGDDRYYVDDVSDVVVEVAGEGRDTILSYLSWSLFDSAVENLRLLGSASSKAVGNALANTIVGNKGNNRIDGGAGADTLSGHAGNDVYYVDDIGDRVREKASGGADTIHSAISFGLADEVETLRLSGTGDIAGTGNDRDNRLFGNGGDNRLDGGLGVDLMRGGAGDDVYHVDNIRDRAIEAAGGGDDSVYSSVSFALSADVEALRLTGTTNIKGTGNVLDNVLTGNAGNNVLSGGLGRDTLNGNGGNDRFDFNALAESGLAGGTADRIVGFASGDRIDLSTLDANVLRPNNGAFKLDKGDAFSAGEVRQTVEGHSLLVELNVDDDAAAEMALLLQGRTALLTATDFIL